MNKVLRNKFNRRSRHNTENYKTMLREIKFVGFFFLKFKYFILHTKS